MQKKKKNIFLPLIVFLIIFTIFSLPHRSVAAYCQVYSSDIAGLTSSSGNSDNPNALNKLSKALDKLESVSPPDIDPSVKIVDRAVRNAINNPTQLFIAGFEVTLEQNRIEDWTNSHCPK